MSRTKKIKPKAPRDLNIKKLITNPKKSGAHKDLKKQENKDGCDENFEDYLARRLRDPYFAKEYNEELDYIETQIEDKKEY